MNRDRSTITGCCRDCQDRYPACHDYCETYQDALKDYREKAKAIREKKAKEYEIRKFEVDSVRRKKKVIKSI